MRSLPFWDVEVFASLIEALSYKSYDVASECLTLGKDVLPGMGREREPFLAMTRALIGTPVGGRSRPAWSWCRGPCSTWTRPRRAAS